MTSISSLDEQIAELEREIGNSGSDSDSSDSYDEEDEEGEELLVEKDEKGRVVRLLSTIAREERIAPLPAQQLPLPFCTKRKSDGTYITKKEKPKKSKTSVRFVDDVVVERERASGEGHQAAPKGASSGSAGGSSGSAGGKSGLEKTIREMLSHYQPSSAERRPFWCRICRFQGADLGSFEAHRASFEHKLAADIEKKMSFCKACRKQFTSIDQLREHRLGKAHLDAEAQQAGRAGGGGKLSFA